MTFGHDDVLNRLDPIESRNTMTTQRLGLFDRGDRRSRRSARASRSSIRDPHVEEPGDVRDRDRRGRSPRWRSSSRGARRVRRVRLPDLPLALVHGAVRQLRRSDGRGARQGAGRHAAPQPQEDVRRASCSPMARPRPCRRSPCARATSFVVAAHELDRRRRRDHRRARRRSTSRPSRANPRRSFANRAATARPSPAARPCSPIRSRSASPPTRARASWTA